MVPYFLEQRTDLHTVLCNITTPPCYQRRAAASALIRRTFEDADRDGVIICLDTEENSNPRRIYESLGFIHVGEATWDLSQYGSTVLHTHIVKIREPQQAK